MSKSLIYWMLFLQKHVMCSGRIMDGPSLSSRINRNANLISRDFLHFLWKSFSESTLPGSSAFVAKEIATALTVACTCFFCCFLCPWKTTTHWSNSNLTYLVSNLFLYLCEVLQFGWSHTKQYCFDQWKIPTDSAENGSGTSTRALGLLVNTSWVLLVKQ